MKNNKIYSPDEISKMSLNDVFKVNKQKIGDTMHIIVQPVFCSYPCFKEKNKKNFEKAAEYLYAFWDINECAYVIKDNELDEFHLCKKRIKKFCKDLLNAVSDIDDKYNFLEGLLHQLIQLAELFAAMKPIQIFMCDNPIETKVLHDICKEFIEFHAAHESMMFKLTD